MTPLAPTEVEHSTLERLRVAIADRYRLEGELGHGGMAIVFRARDLRHDRSVAIKVLRPQIATSIGADRFLSEVRIEANLQHPGIVPLFDSGVVEGLPYYVMPLVEGETLRAMLRREGQLRVEEALRITEEVGDALRYSHGHGYLHRDIKPENILITNGRAVLADFGIARALDRAAAEPRTETGVVHGTPAYMSPEQCGGGQHVDERSDQYALACVLFEMLTGEPPFTGVSAQQVIARHLGDTPRLVTVDRPAVPPAVAEAVARALAKAPADRYPTVGDFLEALVHPVARKSRGAWLVAGVGLIALVAAGVWRIAQSPAAPIDPNKIVVFPLAERGLGVSDSGAGYDAALMLTQAFEHAEPLRWIDVRPRLAEYGVADVSLMGATTAARITRDRGARFYVVGLARQARDTIAVTLQLHDAVGDSVVTQSTSFGPRAAEAFPNLAVEAARGILPALLGGRGVDLSPLVGREPGAVALWMQGERSYRESRFLESLAFFRRAVARDSGLALAALSGAAAASWLNDADAAAPFLAIALSDEGRLPAKHALYARGLDAYLRGVGDSAAAFLEQAIERDTAWPEAHMALGEVYYHLFPALDIAPLDAARREFNTAVRFDSLFAPPLVHLTEQAIRDGDREAALDLLQRLRARDPDAELVQHLELMLSCLGAGRPAGGWAAPVQSSPYDVFTAADALSAGASQPRCAKEALQELLAANVPAGWKWGAFLLLHGLLAAEGRWGEVRTLVDSMAHAGSRVAETLYVIDLAAAAPFDSQAAAVRRYVAGSVGENYERTDRAFTLWLMGVWHARWGEVERTARLAERLEQLGTDQGSGSVVRLSQGLRARVLVARGDTTAAVRLLQGLLPSAPSAVLAWDFTEALPLERLLLARLLLATGREREALLVADGFDHPTPALYLPFVPASLQIRYTAAMALRETRAAEAFRARLVSLGRWDGGETNADRN